MKLVQLSVDGGSKSLQSSMERVPIFNAPADLLWRYPLVSPQPYHQYDLKTHIPNSLASDPRHWSRDDVSVFLRWCEYEFDLPRFDMDFFQMNGKALCFLTKSDLNERSPGCGDVLHNVLQTLIRDLLPSSPLTPHFPLTPTWPSPLPLTKSDFPNGHAHNSVTLSPAPSVDSQGSPRQTDPNIPSSNNNNNNNTSTNNTTNNNSSSTFFSTSRQSGSSGSAPSDSEGEEPSSPTIQNTVSSPPPRSPISVKPQIFFPSETISEPNTNGRLLWDFLQQLLNDSLQRYTSYIAWKNREAGIFKIVDPPGLAKLWGIQKNHLSMNYDKMSRALRYYYRVNILRKVQGERHCYQFLRNPSELKSIKNISLLRHQIVAQQQQQQSIQLQQPAHIFHQNNVKNEHSEEKPTDLSTHSQWENTMNAELQLSFRRDEFPVPQAEDLTVTNHSQTIKTESP